MSDYRRHQPRTKAKRHRVSAALLEKIDRVVTAEARHFHVSKSWIVAVALADAFGIPESSGQADYRHKSKSKGRAA